MGMTILSALDPTVAFAVNSACVLVILILIFRHWKKPKEVLHEFSCGHRGQLLMHIEIDGSEGKYEVPKKDLGKAVCPDCFIRAIIRCAWCGKYIAPNDPVTLYSPKADFKIPEYAVTYSQEPKILVGCLRWNCAEGMDRAGFWKLPGKVERVVSPMEQILAQMHSGDDGMIIVNDLSDPAEAIPFPQEKK